MPPGRRFAWKELRFTVADALTGARLVMLPYLVYGLARPLPGMAVVTLAAMIGTDLIDGRIARRLGQSREFGGAFDSTVDFLVIYTLFTAFFAVGVLAWWKWLLVTAPALLMAFTQWTAVRRAGDVVFAPAAAGKIVGMIQFVYLPLLLGRLFWLAAPWARIADDMLFVLLAVATVVNTLDYLRTLRRLLVRPPQPPTRP